MKIIGNVFLILLIINNNGFLFSACFLNKNNEIFILTSNSNIGINENIKAFDLKGQKIKEIKNSNEPTSYIDTYYDIKLSKYYIVTGNLFFSQSYDYVENNIYRKYKENIDYDNSYIIIMNMDKIIKLVISCSDGNIRIFNFHSGLLLNKIEIINKYLYEMCLYNDKYLLVGL